jgi:hypothetical protein
MHSKIRGSTNGSPDQHHVLGRICRPAEPAAQKNIFAISAFDGLRVSRGHMGQ